MSQNPPGSDPVLPHKSSGKNKKLARAGWFRPGLLLASIIFAWAALHEPPVFSLTNFIVWLLSSITVGVLAKAGLVLAEPLLRLMNRFVRQQMRQAREQTGP